jgi:hypothetical protein
MTEIGDTFTPDQTVEHTDQNGTVISRYLKGERYRVTARNLAFVQEQRGETAPTNVKAAPGKVSGKATTGKKGSK